MNSLIVIVIILASAIFILNIEGRPQDLDSDVYRKCEEKYAAEVALINQQIKNEIIECEKSSENPIKCAFEVIAKAYDAPVGEKIKECVKDRGQ